MFSWQSGIICTRPDLQDVLKGMSRFHGNRLRAAFSAKRGSLSWVLLLDFFDLSVSTDRLLLYHSWQILWPFRIRRWRLSIECFHSRGQHLCKFIGTKKGVYIRTASGNIASMREPLDGSLWWYWIAANVAKKNGASFKNYHRRPSS